MPVLLLMTHLMLQQDKLASCKHDYKHKQAVSVHNMFACQSAVVLSFESVWKVRHLCVFNCSKAVKGGKGPGSLDPRHRDQTL